MTKGVTLPIVGLGTAIIKTGAEYEAGMDEVAAISGATGTEIAALGDKAMEMASKTKFSTAESAEAYKYMAMAGWETEDMLNSISAVMYLAGASGESLASTSDIVTDAMTAFGMAADGNSKVLKDGYEVEISNAQRFTDVLAAASNNANTNVSMLGETFKYVAPVAGAMGYSIEDVAIASGLMANSGIKAGMAGTALRNILTNMSNPTENMAAAMNTLGVSLEDDEGNMYSLLEVMEQLRAGFNGGEIDSQTLSDALHSLNVAFEAGTLSEEDYEKALDDLAFATYGAEGAQKAQLAAMLAGKYGMAGLLSIVSASDEDFNKLTEAIYNSNGATEEMYNIMTDNAQGAVTMLSSAINVLFTKLSEFLIPAFTDIVRKITEVVNWFGSLDAETQKFIMTIAGIAAAVGPVLIVVGNIISAIGKIASGISGLIGIVTKVGGAFSSLFSILAANPIAIVIAAVAALVAGIIVLWNTNEDFRNAVGVIWEAITGFFVSAWEAIQAAWASAGEFFGGIVDGIRGVFEGIGEFLGGVFSAAWELVQAAWGVAVEFFSGIWTGIQTVFSVVADVLGGFFSAAWELIQAAWSAAVDFFSSVWEGIQSVFSVVAEVLGGFFQAAWEAIQTAWGVVVEFFAGVWQGIQDVFSVVADVLGGFFSAAWEVITSVWEAATEFFGGIADGIHSAFETVTQFLGDAFSAAWSLIETAWNVAVDFFSGVWEGISGVFSAAAEWFSGVFSDAWDAVTSAWDGVTAFFSGVWNDITDVFSNVWDKFKEIGGNIVDGIKSGVSGAWDAFTSWLGSKVDGIVNAVKNMLGIHSPSRVFAGIGENMALGLAAGWEDEYSGIKRQIENGLNFGSASIGTNANYSGASGYDTQSPVGRGGAVGNTYVTINSPKAVDGVEAAREWQKTSQRIALGLV